MGYACVRLILVLVWGTFWHTYVPGTSERFLANCGVANPGHTTTARLCVTTAASGGEGVPAVSSIESLMIRRPFGSIDPNSIRETELHKEAAGRPQYGTRYQNFHFDFLTYAFFYSY